MRFHQAVAFLEVDHLLELCRATDDLGFDGIFVSDHICYPKDLQSPYPYSPYEDGSPAWAPESPWPDCWCLISAMAAVTERLTFTTGVYVAPARDLLSVAKQVGTAAVISGDRVRCGVGAGWCKEEFDLTGQEFGNRGARLDDMIPALRALWGGGWVEYHGSHYDVPPVMLRPSPGRPVPVYVGGNSRPAMRRAVQLGDGWMCADVRPPDEAMELLQTFTAELARAGRSESDYPIYMTVAAPPEPDLIRRFEDAGVTDWICAPWMLAEQSSERAFSSTVADKVAAAERFAADVIAKVR